MTYDIVKAEVPSSKKAWGEANTLRGRNHTETAKAFVHDHPVGTVLSAETFDKWLEQHELLTIPPIDAPKNSDPWLGHLQRRHIVRNRINSAATHPRMRDEGSEPFIITSIKGGFEVRSPQVAASKADLAERVALLAETKRKQLAYLMQSADWATLPVHEQGIAETIYDDIEAFAQDTRTAADRISRKLTKLEHRIRQALSEGKITTVNGGFEQLLLSAESAKHEETE